MMLVDFISQGFVGRPSHEGRPEENRIMQKSLLPLCLLVLFILSALSGLAFSEEKEAAIYEKGPLHMESAGGWAGVEKNLYGKVRVRETQGGPGISPIQRVIASVATGEIAFGVDSPEKIFRAREKGGLDLVALSVDFQNSPMRIISWIPVTSSKEIRGDFGVWKGDEAIAKCAIGKGWEKQVTFQDQGEDITLWLSGTWPMASAMAYHELILAQREVKRMGKKFYTIDYRALSVDWMDNVLFTTAEVIRKHPDVVQAIVTGRYRGFQWVFKNVRETVEFLGRDRAGLDAAREMDAVDPTRALMITPDTKTLGLGYILPKKWDNVARDMVRAGLLDRMPDIRKAYTERFPSGVLPR
jgi:NitT/TauT family transport system substrate-binding protein